MLPFTEEEVNLLCIYNTSTRSGLIAEMSGSLPDIYDEELRDIMLSAIGKLEGMTDEQYAVIAPGLVPAK